MTTTTGQTVSPVLDLEAAATRPSLDEAVSAVRRLAGSHYENFSVLSRLVPEALRDDFAAVYAYCRWSDDLGDETGTDDAARARSLELLSTWRDHLNHCFEFAHGTTAESPSIPVFVALARTIRRHELRDEPFHDLIDAFEQDQRVSRYETWDQLLGYCRNSADPVGRIVLALAGVKGDRPEDAHLIEMSDATCTALQLTNFWQDVRRDLIERDRVYLPAAETGITAELLREWMHRPDDPEVRVPFIRAVRPLVERTSALFDRGSGLPEALGGPLGPVIWLFGAGGMSVLRSIERMGCATLWKRPVLSRPKKAALVIQASLRTYRSLGKAGAR